MRPCDGGGYESAVRKYSNIYYKLWNYEIMLVKSISHIEITLFTMNNVFSR